MKIKIKRWLRDNVRSAYGFGGYVTLESLLSEYKIVDITLTKKGIQAVENGLYTKPFAVLTDVKGIGWITCYPA